MRINAPHVILGACVVLMAAGCADPPYRTEVTSGGQGSVNLQRVPVEPRAKPADRIADLEHEVSALRGRLSELEAENTRLRAATQPARP